VVVGLSGGVDSAVAALLLREQGHEVQALFMKNWEEDDREGHCAAAEDLASARAVADHLGIALGTVNFASEYWDRVFARFLSEYRVGRTPNPDILCNSEIKFRAFLDFALARGADYIATGHYAARGERDGRPCLERACDEVKDQTYFLHRLNGGQLRRALFPLAGLSKREVRERARKAGLPNFARKDSTGICFIGERRFREFLTHYLPARRGPMETPDGEFLGYHQGLMYYTIGQRRGLGVGGRAGASEAPWFVAAKDLERNALILAQGHDHPLLLHPRLEAAQVHWIRTAARPGEPLSARIRHRQPLQACRILGFEGDRCRVEFGAPQWAIAPGQAVVFYRGRECLGGAVIERALP